MRKKKTKTPTTIITNAGTRNDQDLRIGKGDHVLKIKLSRVCPVLLWATGSPVFFNVLDKHCIHTRGMLASKASCSICSVFQAEIDWRITLRYMWQSPIQKNSDEQFRWIGRIASLANYISPHVAAQKLTYGAALKVLCMLAGLQTYIIQTLWLYSHAFENALKITLSDMKSKAKQSKPVVH